MGRRRRWRVRAILVVSRRRWRGLGRPSHPPLPSSPDSTSFKIGLKIASRRECVRCDAGGMPGRRRRRERGRGATGDLMQDLRCCSLVCSMVRRRGSIKVCCARLLGSHCRGHHTWRAPDTRLMDHVWLGGAQRRPQVFLLRRIDGLIFSFSRCKAG